MKRGYNHATFIILNTNPSSVIILHTLSKLYVFEIPTLGKLQYGEHYTKISIFLRMEIKMCINVLLLYIVHKNFFGASYVFKIQNVYL